MIVNIKFKFILSIGGNTLIKTKAKIDIEDINLTVLPSKLNN